MHPEPRTSRSHPLHVDWITDLPAPGVLGLTLCPGKWGSSLFGRPWARDLEFDLALLREHHRTDLLVSLMEDHEYAQLRVPDLVSRAKAHGLDVVHFPIPDVSVPPPDRHRDFDALVDRLRAELDGGSRVVVHCRGGLGRTGLTAAALLTTYGDDPNQAIARVRATRRGAVETPEQEDFVAAFARRRSRHPA
jgi:ADP-ribosyl-[dinitrogen reductase] hydrolase